MNDISNQRCYAVWLVHSNVNEVHVYQKCLLQFLITKLQMFAPPSYGQEILENSSYCSLLAMYIYSNLVCWSPKVKFASIIEFRFWLL